MTEVPQDPAWDAPTRRWPALRLLSGIGLALHAPALLLAMLGVLLMWGGWSLLDRAFPGTEKVTPLTHLSDPLGPVRIGWEPVAQAAWIVTDPIRVPLEPARAVFAIGGGTERFVHGLIATLWAGLVWTLIGGAIARLAILRVANGTRRGAISGLGFSARKAGTLIAAPAIPMVGVAFLTGVTALLGLLYQPAAAGFGLVAGALAFLPLLIGIVLLWLLVGLAVGWPLMVASVAAEGEDSFDALSRSFSYVFQRPVLLAILAAVAWAVGTGGVLLVVLLARMLLHLTAWALAFGAPDAKVASLFGALAADPKTTVDGLHAGWVALVTLLAYSWVFAYVWSAVSQIYLLVRQDVDGTPIEDVAGEASPEPKTESTLADPAYPDKVPMPPGTSSGPE
jgi:hypothetical protein